MKIDKEVVCVIVYKLIGPIEPVGETREDNIRFENLKQMTALVEKLLTDISRVCGYTNRHEASMSRAGKYADQFMAQIQEAYTVKEATDD
jgi:hypothetical protein